MIFTYQHNDETYTVRLDPQADGSFLAQVNDEAFSVSAAQLASGGWLLETDDGRAIAYVATEGRAASRAYRRPVMDLRHG